MQFKQLLDGEFAPLTYAIGFIEAPLQFVGDAFYNWQSSHCKKVTTSPFRSCLSEALSKLPPLVMPPRRQLLMQTNSAWTAYFDNGTNGGDPFPPMSYLAEHLKHRGLAVTCVPHTLKSEHKNAKGTYGAVQFELFAPEPREFLNYERSVSAANDGGPWVFQATGTVQSYEQTERYAASKIKDRFTPKMLEDYCRALAIDVFDANFYGPQAILVQIHDPLPRSHKPQTLHEARQGLGLEP